MSVLAWLRKVSAFLGQHAGLIVVLGTALSVRLSLLKWWNAAPYGDVLNFVRIAEALSDFVYPVAEKRLPFYPFLILVTHAFLPHLTGETVAIIVAIAMSLLCLGLLYAIGRTLGLRKVPLLGALLLFMSYPPFLTYSIRGYADTTFVALLLGSTLVALRLRGSVSAIILGTLLGALSLTRYEGVVASGVIALIVTLRSAAAQQGVRVLAKRFTLVLGAAILVVLPFVVISWRSGRSLLPHTYLAQAQEAEEGYGADSFHEWRDHYMEIWNRLGIRSLWQVPQELALSLGKNPFRWHERVADTAVLPRFVGALLACVGLTVLLRRRQWYQLSLVTLPWLTVAVPVAWWASYIRYDAFVFPVVALAVAAGWHGLAEAVYRGTAGSWGKTLRWALAALLLFLSTLWMLRLTGDTYDSMEKSRNRDRAQYEAIQYARRLLGNILFEEYLDTVNMHLSDRARYLDNVWEGVPAEERWLALQQAGISHVIFLGQSGRAEFWNTPPSQVEMSEVARYRFRQGDNDVDEAAIYAITFSK